MDTLLMDLRYGARSLLKSPGFCALAVVALALGIGANVAIFNVVNAVLLRPLPFPDPERLMSVWSNNVPRGWHKDVVTPADFIDWRNDSQSFESMAAYTTRGFNLGAGAEAQRVQGAVVSADFFKVLREPPALGRDFRQDDGRSGGDRVAIISHALWQRLGGDPEEIGRSIALNSEIFTVIGVAPDGVDFPEKEDVWALARNIAPESAFLSPSVDITRVRGVHYIYVIARLKDGVTLARAQAEMDTIASRLRTQFPDTNANDGVEIIPLHEAIVGDVRPALLVFAGAVGLVLLIACANVANMSLARAAGRRREIAIRTALGAGRIRIVRQCLTESVLLAMLGGCAGLLLALWGADLIVTLGAQDLPGAHGADMDPVVLVFALALSLVTGILFGLAPALTASAASPNEALAEGGRGSTAGRRARWLRSCLVVCEIAVALVLLAGAGLLARSFSRLLDIDLGLDIDRVLTLRVWIPDLRYADGTKQVQFYDGVLDRVAALPGVQAASATSDLPLGGNDSILGFLIEGRPAAVPGSEPESGFHQVSPDFFRVLRIPLLRGRLFGPEDRAADSASIVISDTMARRYWPDEEVIGKRISYGSSDSGVEDWGTIVGVVADVRQRGPNADLRAEAYVSSGHWPSRYMTLMVRSDLPAQSLAAAVRREVLAVDPEVPVYDIKTMREVLDGSLSGRRFNMALLVLFAGVALALAVVGIYGVMSYAVTQRTHEIGVRMALGARQVDVLLMIVGQGTGLALSGVALGLAASFALTRLLASLLFGVSATDPVTLAGVSMLLAVVALFASWIPARRATRVDPMVALRHE